MQISLIKDQWYQLKRRLPSEDYLAQRKDYLNLLVDAIKIMVCAWIILAIGTMLLKLAVSLRLL